MKRAWLVFLIYGGLTVALTYPLVLHMGSVLPNDAGDPALNTWILWWNAQTVPFTPAWWNAPAFYPVPGVLTFSENLLGLSFLSTPLSWLGVGPQAAYNIVFLLTFPLSAIGAYLLTLELTQRRDAAFLAGLLFGFAPYRIAHLPQIQSLASFPMPFALMGLHRYLRDPRPKWLALFAAGWFLQGLCNGYYLLFFSVFVGIWVLWFAAPWSRPRQFVAISMAWLAAAVPIVPILWHYRQVHASFGFTRDFDTIRDFGADVAALLYASHHIALWGWLNVFRRAEGELFPGLTITLLIVAGALFVRDPARARAGRWAMARLALAGLAGATAILSLSAVVLGTLRFELLGTRVLSMTNPIRPLKFSLAVILGLALISPGLRRAWARRSVLGFYALAGCVMWLFSLGPAPSLMGKPLMERGPYALLMFLPGFNALRVPARFWMVSTLCLAVIGAFIFDRLTATHGRMRRAAAIVVAIGVLVDAWMAAMPLADTPRPFRVFECGEAAAGPMAQLPLGVPSVDVAAMYRQMSHRRPLVNGYSGYFPPHYAALRFGLLQKDQGILTQLAAHGIVNVIVDRESDRDGGWDAYVRSNPGATHICTQGEQSLYRISPAPGESGAAALPASPGDQLPVAVIRPSLNADRATLMTDGDLTTRWESGPQTERAMIDVDLGALRTVSGVDLLLGPFVQDFARGLVIEASEEGQSWTEVWRGSSAGLAFVGAFEAPREVPVAYRFPAVRARLLRLRLTSEDDTYYWSIAELKVLGR